MPRILLIEDEEDLRAELRAKLLALGHQVDEAPNGKVGIEQFRKGHPDLVITDMLMPEMEGMETIRCLREIAPTVKIIAMSAGGRNPAGVYLRIAEKLGAGATLAKPFSNAELEYALSRLLPPPDGKTEARTFLVLDDNRHSRLLNRCVLEEQFPSSKVVECGSVEEALSAATTGDRIDAVVTDHHLGTSDGAEFLTKLRLQGINCPVIMVTGSADPKVHERAYRAGAARVFFGNDTDFAGYLRTTLAKS